MKMILMMVVMLSVGSVYGSLVYDDNLEHTIDFVHMTDGVSVRNNTIVNVIDGAELYLTLSDNATVNIKGGEIWGLSNWEASTTNITGGNFRYQRDYVFANDTVTHIKGGLFWSYQEGIMGADTNVEQNAKLIFYGTDFTHTNDGPGRYYINGILENGDVLDNFQVDVRGPNASIQFVPEPATLAMLALGGMLIRRRRAT